MTILLSSILLCSCVTGANKEDKDEVKKVKADCEYYKNTPNYINWDLKENFDKETNAFYSLAEKKTCEGSNCSIFSKLKKWKYIEIELNNDKNNTVEFPRTISENGIYRIYKDFDFFVTISKEEKIKHINKELLCRDKKNCITCYTKNYCLIGQKISKNESNITIEEKAFKKTKYSNLYQYRIMYKGKLYIEYNQYIFQGNDLYSGLGYGFCENTKNFNIIMENLFKDEK